MVSCGHSAVLREWLSDHTLPLTPVQSSTPETTLVSKLFLRQTTVTWCQEETITKEKKTYHIPCRLYLLPLSALAFQGID